LANENAEDDRASTIRDTLLITRKFLINHPEECIVISAAERLAQGMKKIETDLESPAAGVSSYGGSRRGCKHGVHGSAECISKFLSDKNWKQSTIYNYLGITEDVADHVANNGSTHPESCDRCSRHFISGA
jgi:hypothetical protein